MWILRQYVSHICIRLKFEIFLLTSAFELIQLLSNVLSLKIGVLLHLCRRVIGGAVHCVVVDIEELVHSLY